MNLIELYDSLELPDSEPGNYLSAVSVPQHPNFRIAIDKEGNPVLLLTAATASRGSSIRNFRLKNLKLEQNVECRITESGKSFRLPFTIITFTNSNRDLQEYFLRIAETLIKSLNTNPTPEQLSISLNKFIEVFRSMSDTPTKTVHGLWTELFLISNSNDPKALLNFWHEIPEETFDFNSGQEKIEVKSSSRHERIHIFSSEQLNPPIGTQVLIASIFIRQNINGVDILQLVESITNKVRNHPELIEKLISNVIKTLGSTLDQSTKIKFDIDIAKESLRFYKHQDLGKIEKIYIPDSVTEVRFKSDLSELYPINLTNLKSKGELFLGL